ncbi:protein of unknown function [Paenibacillus alvei]|uniref:Transposase n=1 Tax=Paenibacillus alvei TaxID=44250 RepID=A0A383R7X5_PAEAL|nr:protein of unknown function [Paenibacillus alvei]
MQIIISGLRNIKLTKLEILGSHSRRGDCFDNAYIELFFSQLKTEKFERSQKNLS